MEELASRQAGLEGFPGAVRAGPGSRVRSIQFTFQKARESLSGIVLAHSPALLRPCLARFASNVNRRYHLTARGSEREVIYREDRNRFHFLDYLAT